jgi:STE24 endopeptidase
MRFDPAAATAAYIDGLGAEALATAQAYTIGNHWLLLWGLLVTVGACWIVARSGLLDRLAARLSRRGFALRTWLVATTFLILLPLITLPWNIYEEWWREGQYGRSSQPLSDYLVQGGIALVIGALIGGLFFLALYALIRWAGRTWWLWSGGLAAATISAILLLSPIVIEPLFNEYQPVPEGPVRTALLKMADEAQIPHDRVLMYDGSRQSNNFTANVSGVFGSARIAISDVALGEASLDEVKAVTGHEIGHYVLGHIWQRVLVFSILAILLFFLADRLFVRVARLFGSNATIGDPTGLPVLMAIVSGLGLLATPVDNWLTRMSESEADAYSLRTVNLPDALSGALVKTAEYRYPRPHPLQEAIFYTHPSVETRVRRAMEWKAAHIAESAAAAASTAREAGGSEATTKGGDFAPLVRPDRVTE